MHWETCLSTKQSTHKQLINSFNSFLGLHTCGYIFEKKTIYFVRSFKNVLLLSNSVKSFNTHIMASKDRILRQKEETRQNILDAAYDIVKEDGWQGLSMRKIADRIEYTAPIIYEYFSNKEAILQELTKKGFILLIHDLENAKAKFADADKQLEAMWMAYWHFAFQDKEMYQVMFGVEMTCCMQKVPEAEAPFKLFTKVIAALMPGTDPPGEAVKQKYFTFFSVIHGLISINIVGNGLSAEINNQILKDAIGGIINSIQVPAA